MDFLVGVAQEEGVCWVQRFVEVEGVRSEQTWCEIVAGEFCYYYKFPNRSHCL